jgi:hypothetical protein
MGLAGIFWINRLVLACAILGLAAGWSVRAEDEPVGVKIPVKLTFPGAGFASVAVYNAQNELIRTLSYAKPVTGAEEAFTWDGTTDLGLPAAPGSYHVHGVFFPQPPKINYLMKVALSGNPPYLTDDDRCSWGGNLGPPMDICTNGKNLLAIFVCVESPKITGIQLMDLDGNITHRFTSFYGWDGRLACTMDDKNAYLAIIQIGAKRLFIGKYDLDKPPGGKILCDIPTVDHSSETGLWKGRWTAEVKGLALNNGRLYVPVFMDDKLFVVDSVTGKILNSVSVSSPRGVTAHDGHVFLLSGKTLVPLDADGNPAKTPLIAGLDDPSGVAIDAKGNFYISDQGASQQVKVFTPDGMALREIGIKGGRPREGVYNPAGLLNPRGLCVTPDGKVWVASAADDFQEVTAWNPDGTRDKVFYNCQIQSGQGQLTPDRSEMLDARGYFASTPGLTAYKVDFEHGTWAPSWHIDLSHEMMFNNDVLLGNKHSMGPYTGAFDGRQPYLAYEQGMVQGTNGKTYLVGGDFSIWLFDPVTKKAKPASLVSTHRVTKTADGKYENGYDQGANNWLTWSDLNGDGKMSLDEVTYTENPPLLAANGRMMAWELQPDLSILFLGGIKVMEGTTPVAKWVIFRLKPKQVLPTGVPVYDWADLQQEVVLQMPDFKGGGGDYKDPRTIAAEHLKLANGAVYLTATAISKAKLHMSGVDGDGWWASRNWRMSPMKFDLKTGQPAWIKLGRRAAGVAAPGEMYYPGWPLAGSVNGIDYFPDTIGQVWAWTDDGLFLGRLYHDDPSGNIFDANGIFVELTGSYVYGINGKTYILTGDQGVSVHQIVEPALTPMDGGTLTLTAEQSAQVKSWDPDGPPPGKKPTYVARSIFDFDRNVMKNTRTITVDGKLDSSEWDGVPKMDLNLDGKKVGTVQVTFDNTNLYLAYEVTDPNGLKNDGHELPYAPFVSGSYVDFDLAPFWSESGRPAPADGDVRVLMARVTGAQPSDYQMGFWALKKNLFWFTPKPKQLNPQDVVSPAQSRHFDDVSPVSGLKFAYQVTGTGYTLEVSVPCASLGMNPSRMPIEGFDASVAFSDAAGQVRQRATHWAGESETTVVDRPGSAELKPQTWGTLEFDRTPLPPVEAGNTSATK